jgi:diacylglycerol kinase family enzyme
VTTPQPDAPSEPTIAAVVYNPIKIDLDEVRREVARAESAAGYGTTLWFETSEEDVGQGVARQALEAGADLVISAGGDGTVRAVAEVVAGTEATFAIVPAGTGNLLARNMKLPLGDVAAAIDVAFSGSDHAIDVGVIDVRRADESVDRHTFVVMAGAGLDAKMIEATDEDLKKRAGVLAYVQALARVLRDRSNLHLRYRVDGGSPQRVTAHTLIVANCGSLPGKILLLPEAQIDDGVLDVLFLQPGRLLGWVQIFAKVLWENGVVSRIPGLSRLRSREVRTMNTATGRRVRASFSRPEQLELDGDGIGEATAFAIRIEAGGLTVRMPAA